MQVSNATLATTLATLLQQKQQQAPPMVPALMPQALSSSVMPSLSFDASTASPFTSHSMVSHMQQAASFNANLSSALRSHQFPSNSLGNPSPATVPASPNNAQFESQLKSLAEQIARLKALTSSATLGVANEPPHHAKFHHSAHPATSPAAGFPCSPSPSSRTEAQPPTPAHSQSPQFGASRGPSSEHGERGGGKSARKIFPRRKVGELQRNTHNPVMLNEYVLAEYFDMPLLEASKKLGICQTTLKKTCRKFGIHKWPYKTRRLESPPHIPPRGD